MPSLRNNTVEIIKAKAVVGATLDNNVASILAFLKQHGPALITSGSRRDLSLIQAAIETLRLIETERQEVEAGLIQGYMHATRKGWFTRRRP